jgi:beta-phosphoglucomutase family hydrolase
VTTSPRSRLPASVRACLFDLDGVITQTARVHAQAWKQTFDTLLAERASAERAGGGDWVPFDIVSDYERFVDGRPRDDGVRTFLAARAITLPEGAAGDPADAHTVQGVARRKDDRFRELAANGVEVYPGSVRLLEAVREEGRATACVSASKNARWVLEGVHLVDHFDVIVDGVVAEERHLAGKPAADTFRAAAELLGRKPHECVVFEDAEAGVAAGRAGDFGLVVGVDRGGHADALLAHGADRVVQDLAELMERP